MSAPQFEHAVKRAMDEPTDRNLDQCNKSELIYALAAVTKAVDVPTDSDGDTIHPDEFTTGTLNRNQLLGLIRDLRDSEYDANDEPEANSEGDS